MFIQQVCNLVKKHKLTFGTVDGGILWTFNSDIQQLTVKTRCFTAINTRFSYYIHLLIFKKNRLSVYTSGQERFQSWLFRFGFGSEANI